jgi:hypothetical protein
MKQQIGVIFMMISWASVAQEITTVDIMDQTLRIKGSSEEVFYLGFAAGDKLVINMKEVNGKELREIEITQHPATVRFSEFKVKQISNKVISIPQESIFKFRLASGALAGRTVNIHIQRIPATPATATFNTTVSWIVRQDTTWSSYTKDIVVGYDTTWQPITRKELLSVVKNEVLITDKTVRVHSETNQNGNKTSIFFTLPQNTVSPTKTEEVIAWAYWVGVGEEANQAWQQNATSVGTLITGLAEFTSPLGALALGLVADLIKPSIGEDVMYAVTDAINRDLFHAGQPYRTFDYGKGVAGYHHFVNNPILQGTYFICLLNDNVMQGINANVKVVAIVETRNYEMRTSNEQRISPRTEKRIIREPIIRTTQVPVLNN